MRKAMPEIKRQVAVYEKNIPVENAGLKATSHARNI
jgi:hypothetical protein